MSTFSPSITPSESLYLNTLPITSWGILGTEKNGKMLISHPYGTLHEAQKINDALSQRIKQTFNDYFECENKVFKLKKGDSAAYAVVVVREIIQMAASKELAPSRVMNTAVPLLYQNEEAPIAKTSVYDIDTHPLDLLDQWKAQTPGYAQASMSKQLNRAQRMHGPKEEDPKNWVEKNTHACRIMYDQGDLNGYTYGFATTNGKRQTNEDTYYTAVIELQINDESVPIPFFGVLDGHSQDKSSGRLFTKHFINTFAPTFKETFEQEYAGLEPEKQQNGEWVELALFNALKLAFVKVSNESNERYRSDSLSGTTATVSLIYNGSLYTACSGDSRAMLLTNTQSLPISWDAKVFNPENDPLESEKFNRSIFNRASTVSNMLGNGYRSESGLNLTHSLGHGRHEGINARPKITKVALPAELKEDSYVLCATDGFWDVAPCSLAARSVLDYAKDGQTCDAIAKALVKTAFNSESKDNITILLLKISGKGKTGI